MKEKILKKKYLFYSLLFTLGIIILLFLTKNIYPFGNNPLNGVDFDSGYVPVYYKLWDILHGNSSILFDWNLGAGLNCFGSLIMNSLISPTSLIIGLFTRSSIPYTISYVYILKLLFMNLCTFYALDKMFPKLKGIYKVILTNFYVFSGWTLLMSNHLLYLDAVALFPLFVYSYFRLMKEDKGGFYIFILSLILLLNYYMAWMVLFFIIGLSFISLITLNIPNKKEKAIKVFLFTLVSLGISCALFLPSFYQSLSSYRLNGGTDILYHKSSILLMEKLLHIFPLGILTALSLKCFKDKNKNSRCLVLLLLYIFIGVFIEPINQLWHTGSYADLCFRYSYIPTFILILSSALYLSNTTKENKRNMIQIGSSILMIGIYALFFILMKEEMLNAQLSLSISKYSQFFGPFVLFLISIFTTFIILKNDSKIKNILLFLFSFLTIFTFSYLYIQYPSKSGTLKTQEFSNRFHLINDSYNYVDQTMQLNINFPYILRVPSMQNRLHIIKEEEINFRDEFGYYSVGDTLIYSTGGNLFTDLLMQNKYYFSNNLLNPSFYDLISQDKDVYFYQAKYSLPHVIFYTGDIYNIKDDQSAILNTNIIYQHLFSKNDSILEEDHTIKNDLYYEFLIEPKNTYYLKVDYEHPVEEITNLNVLKEFSYLSSDSNHSYMTFYANEKKRIEIPKENIKSIALYHINEDKYKEFIESFPNLEVDIKDDKNKRTYEVISPEKGKLLLPINYDENFQIKINGKVSDYELNCYNMFSIDIEEGTNIIEMEYTPKYLKEGVIISIFSIIITLIFSFLNKKYSILKNKIICYPLFSIVLFIGVLFILKVYILSWLF